MKCEYEKELKIIADNPEDSTIFENYRKEDWVKIFRHLSSKNHPFLCPKRKWISAKRENKNMHFCRHLDSIEKGKNVFFCCTSCEIARKVRGEVVYDKKMLTKFDDFFKKQHFVHAITCHHVCWYTSCSLAMVCFVVKNRKICYLILTNTSNQV